MRTTFSTSIMTCVALAALPACAADMTYERLFDPEPQNWVMHHHDYTHSVTPRSTPSIAATSGT